MLTDGDIVIHVFGILYEKYMISVRLNAVTRKGGQWSTRTVRNDNDEIRKPPEN